MHVDASKDGASLTHREISAVLLPQQIRLGMAGYCAVAFAVAATAMLFAYTLPDDSTESDEGLLRAIVEATTFDQLLVVVSTRRGWYA